MLNRVKVRAPEGYATVAVALSGFVLEADDSANRFSDAWAVLDARGTEAVSNEWRAGEEADGRAHCEVLSIAKKTVDSEPAVEVLFRLTLKAAGEQLLIRGVLVLHEHQWFAFQFATTVKEEPRFSETFLTCEQSIRWRK